MISPTDGIERKRVRAVFFLHQLERMEKAQGKRAAEIKRYLSKYERGSRFAKLRTSKFDDYRRLFDLVSLRSKYIRSMLTVGLTVKVMASDHGVSRLSRRTVRAAQQYIIDHCKGRLPVYANGNTTRKVWAATYKPVAHLCAALIDFTPFDVARPAIGEPTLKALEENIEAFCRTAEYYQRFLMGKTVINNVSIFTRSQGDLRLARLPRLHLAAQSQERTDLPVWASP